MQSSSTTTPPLPLSRSGTARSAGPGTPGSGQPPRHDFPPFTTTVPRQYVHRAAVSEVFLTNWETDGSDGFTVGAQWPRGHVLYRPRYGQQDPLLLAETIRQAGVLLAHTGFGVPLDHHFLMWDLSYAAAPGTLRAGPLPTDLTLRVTCHDVSRRGKQLSSMRYRAEVWRGATRVAVGSAGFTCTSDAVYQRLRGDRREPRADRYALGFGLDDVAAPTPAAPLAPRDVGHTDPRDVALAEAPGGLRTVATVAGRRRGEWRLRVDPTHPVHFDHPQDHVPGMLLVEAARQAAQVLLGPGPVHPVALHATFEHYAELATPCRIEAEAGAQDAAGRTQVAVTARQNGRTPFSATVTCLPLA